MNLFFRQSIIVLLLLLQGLSPLVHAHVQEDTGEYGLHIDGFRALTENSPQFSAFDSIAHTDVVIGMRPAIRQKNLLSSDLPNTGLNEATQDFTQAALVEKRLLYDLSVFVIEASIDLSVIAPRAPPFITFL